MVLLECVKQSVSRTYTQVCFSIIMDVILTKNQRKEPLELCSSGMVLAPVPVVTHLQALSLARAVLSHSSKPSTF